MNTTFTRLLISGAVGICMMSEPYAADFEVSLDLETANIHEDAVSAEGFCAACQGECSLGALMDGGSVIGQGDWTKDIEAIGTEKSYKITYSFDALAGQDPAAATHYSCVVHTVGCSDDAGKLTSHGLRAISGDRASIAEIRSSNEAPGMCNVVREDGTVYRVMGVIGETPDLEIPSGDMPFPEDKSDEDEEPVDIDL